MAPMSKLAVPCLPELVQVHFGQAKNLVALVTAKTLDESKLQWIEPELGGAVTVLHVDVRRFEAVSHVEKETVASLAEDGWHVGIVAVNLRISRSTLRVA